MQGLLFGLGTTVVVVIGGLLATFGSPGAMFDALLAPFSNEHRKRHVRYRIDSYYAGLTKELLQSQLRSDLLANNRQDVFRSELGEASGKQNGLRRLFDEFAVNHGQSGRKVWTETQFAALISSRLGADSAAHILWRCFCYNANYPFTNISGRPEQHEIDIDGWTQAIALLATDAVHGVGRNRAQLPLYGPSQAAESRKLCSWRRFVSFAVPSTGDGTGEDDDWLPPNVLDEVANVAATQLPLDMSAVGPPLSEIRPMVEKVVAESDRTKGSIRGFAIPYQDMLNLLGALLQVREPGTPGGDSIDDEPRSTLSLDIDRKYQIAVAKGILEIGGIHQGFTVSFAAYLAFSEKFYSSDQWRRALSLDRELTTLWRAIFSSPDNNSSASSPPHRHPPSLALQAVDFLYPFQSDLYGRRDRQRSTLVYSSDSVLSRDGILQALTWPFGSKFVLIYGTTKNSSPHGSQHTGNNTLDSDDGQPAIFAILTSSPLWCTYKNGQIDDFYVGDTHLLLELAPWPRCLWYSGEQTKYANLVNTADNNLITFGQDGAGGTGGPGRSSGLVLDFDNGVATLRSLPAQAKEQDQGYVEIPVGPRDGPSKKMERAEAWETAVRIQKIDLYSGQDGVATDLSVRRTGRG